MPKNLSRRAFIVGGIATLAYLYYDIHSVAVKRYTLEIQNLPKDFQGFTILHLTDLHGKVYGDNQSRILDLINQQSFDIVALTGDFVDKGNPDINPAIALIKGLQPKPVFFVPGNHEWWSDFQCKAALENIGVQVLDNKSYQYIRGSSQLWVMGVDDPYLGRDRLDKALEYVSGSTASSQPKVLLAHAPDILTEAAKNNVDVVLVGHTHGGQVRLPFVGAIVAPGQGLFPKYDYGQFNIGQTTMIINGGLGESVLPLRFYNRPEIVLVTLVSA